MDNTDRKILALLQEDAAQPDCGYCAQGWFIRYALLATHSKLQEDGIIRARVALLDGAKIGFGMSVFVAIKTDQHNSDWLTEFACSDFCMIQKWLNFTA